MTFRYTLLFDKLFNFLLNNWLPVLQSHRCWPALLYIICFLEILEDFSTFLYVYTPFENRSTLKVTIL